MLLTGLVVLVVSGALVAGAAWGTFGRLPSRLEGLVIALAGGALVVAAVLELIDPATDAAPVWAVAGAVLVGAGAFVGLDRFLEHRWGTDSGGGLLAAITLDGIPENLALGVALIGASPLQVAALAGSILLSNLPEAAGGAKEMVRDRPRGQVMLLWTATAVVLSAAALAGYVLLDGAGEGTLGLIRCVAGGAVVASLATTVFPKAFSESRSSVGVAAAVGVVLAIALDQLA